MKKLALVAVSTSLFLFNSAQAALPGDLDASFNSTGIVATLPAKVGTGFVGNDLIQQKDGKLTAAGYTYDKKTMQKFALLRYGSNGSLDTDFNGTGVVITAVNASLLRPQDVAHSVVQQKDGKLLAAGTSYNGLNKDFALVRYNKDGSLDLTFNDTGILTTAIGSADDNCTSVIQQTDGKIVAAGNAIVAGNTDFAMVRYERDGSLDASFGTNGVVTTDINGTQNFGKSVIQLSDGKLLMAGYSDYEFILVRYDEDGSLDTTFNASGYLFASVSTDPDYGNQVIAQADGKLVVAGYTKVGNSDDNFAIIRLNPNGTFDTTFSGDGKLIMPVGTSSDIAASVVQQADGKLVMAGSSYVGGNIHFALVRLNLDGTPDASFSADGIVTTAIGSVNDQAYSIIQQADGKLVLVGYGNSGKFNYLTMARYHSENDTDNDGVPDSFDALPTNPAESVDTDADSLGNNADTDDDGDAVADTADNCPLDANSTQADADNDGYGDVCDDAAPWLDVVKGALSKDRAGYSVAFVGDVDKDLVGDYIVGMPGFDAPGKIDAGTAIVISGKTGLPLMSITGGAPKDAMGSAVAGNADVNNDGYMDVIVGAPKADFGSLLDTGSATVMFGPNDGITRQTYYGSTAKALFGSAVALGEVSGDAFADMIIGAPKDDDTTHPFTTVIDAGSVTVRSGDPATYSATQPLQKYYGVLAKAYAGTSVAVGDFNGDSKGDVIIGAPNDDDTFTDPDLAILDTGSVTVYDIGSNTIALMNEYGATAKAYLGKSVASADIDSDGNDDVLVGAPGDDQLNDDLKVIKKDAGSVNLYSGGDGSFWLSYYGRTVKAGMGNSVAFGDVNGDLIQDIIAGASKDDKPAKKPIKDVGSVSIWSGEDMSLIDALYGKVSKDYFGASVSAGDINNDSSDDLIIGVSGSDRSAVPPAKPVKDTGSMEVLSGANL